MQIFIHCKTTLHVSGVTAPNIRSIKNCTRSLRHRSYYLYCYSPPTWSDRDWFVPVQIRSRRRGVAVQVWPVPEAAGTVFNTPDDGCCDTRNMYSSFAVNKYLHTVASVGFLFTLKLYMFRTVPLSIIRSFSLYTQQWYMSYRFADRLRAVSGWNQFRPDIYHCCVYSEKLLMMDRGTVWNM